MTVLLPLNVDNQIVIDRPGNHHNQKRHTLLNFNTITRIHTRIIIMLVLIMFVLILLGLGAGYIVTDIPYSCSMYLSKSYWQPHAARSQLQNSSGQLIPVIAHEVPFDSEVWLSPFESLKAMFGYNKRATPISKRPSLSSPRHHLRPSPVDRLRWDPMRYSEPRP